MQSPIQSVKHIIQRSDSAVATGAISEFVIAAAKPKGDAFSATSSVAEGCVIKAVYCELWLNGDQAGVNTQVTTILSKQPSGAAAADATAMATLNGYANKKNILFTSQGVLGAADNQSVPFMRGWYKIPRGKQRMGVGDEISWTVFNGSAGNLRQCGLAVYKEYN